MEKYKGLKDVLSKKNISQRELANAVDMQRTTLNIKINRYDGRDFTLREAQRISDYLNISINDFF